MEPIEMNSILFWGAIAGFGGAVFFWIVFKLIAEKIDDSFSSGFDGVLLGIAERFFFVFATCFSYPSFPLLWVGLKVGVQSNYWTTGDRKLLNVYLFMNLVSVAIGYLCAWAVFGFEDPSNILRYFRDSDSN